MSALMTRLTRGRAESLVKTEIDLATGPRNSVVSSTARTEPVAPGRIIRSYLATVQPQEGLTSVISKLASPSLRISKAWASFSPLSTLPTSITGSGTTAFGPAATAIDGINSAASAMKRSRGRMAQCYTARPLTPSRLDIYLIAIGGTGMAPLACLLKEAGHRVRGADGPLYPPMSTLLEGAGIRPLEGYDPAHLEPRPDLVVVGNAVPRSNPEAQEAERLELERISMPQALARFFLAGRRPLVVAGTHGKTTISSMAASVYSACGADPGFLVGGVPRNLERSFRRGAGARFIVEGDEYNAAYFDRGPKFLHYRPQTLILTSVEYDHADLYREPEQLLAAYRSLVELLPEDGLLLACGDSDEVLRVAERARCPVRRYGLGPGNDLRPAGEVESGPRGSRFAIEDEEAGRVEIGIRLSGGHNVANALAVWGATRADGLAAPAVADALAAFTGVKRRMEELGSAGGVTVVDDFAHHPTAVGETLAALRARYPGRRLVAVFEPRSLTAGRRIFFDAYLRAFERADRVVLAPLFHAGRLEPGERLDLDELTRKLGERGVEATAHGAGEDLLGAVRAGLRPGDVVVTMSSGEFGRLPQRLLEALVQP